MSRYNSKIRGFQRLFLIERDGNKCAYCGVEGLPVKNDGRYDLDLILRGGAGETDKKILEIHHIDKDLRGNNIKLACHKCNCQLRSKGEVGAVDSGLKGACAPVCERVNRSSAQQKFKRLQETTSSIERAMVLRPLFKAYCIQRIIETNIIVEDIVNSFIVFVEDQYGLVGWGSDRGCYRYLGFMTSSEGDFLIETLPNGTDVLKFKTPEHYEFYKNHKLPSLDDLI